MLGLVHRLVTRHDRPRIARPRAVDRQAVADIQFIAQALEHRPDKDLNSRVRQLRECRLSLRNSPRNCRPKPSDARRARAYSCVALNTQIAIAQRTGTPTNEAPINQKASEMRSAMES